MIYPFYCEYSIDAINAEAKTDPRALIAEAETAFSGQIEQAIRQFGDRRILCLAGPSASGKTTTAHKLEQELKRQGREALVLSMDDFFKPAAQIEPVDGKVSFEVIEALDLPLLKRTITQLLTEGHTAFPSFDFNRHIREDNALPVTLSPDGCVIIEGIHGLNEQVTECFSGMRPFRVYVSPHSGFQNATGVGIDKRQVRLIRRAIRDCHHRSSPLPRTLELWEEVCRAEDLYIRPMARFADLRINSVHLYEPGLFRDEALDLFGSVPKESRFREMAQNLCWSLHQFVPISADLVPKESLLREFTKN